MDKCARILSVLKANYGPGRIQMPLAPIRTPDNSIVGFQAAGQWDTQAKREVGRSAWVPGDP